VAGRAGVAVHGVLSDHICICVVTNFTIFYKVWGCLTIDLQHEALVK
jgi:hypothetical protein